MSRTAKSGDGRMPWLRFYGADWRGDAGLRASGFAARGLWMDMLTLMHEAEPYGHLVVNGAPLDAARLAARVGGTAKEVQGLLDRLEMEGVFSRTGDGVIFSRRMVRDKQKADRDRDNGKGGGNPALKDKAEDTPPDNGSDNGGVNPQDKARAEHAPATQKPEARSQKEGSLRSPRARAARDDPDFAAFYAAYPRHEAPDDALKAWRQVRAAGADVDAVMAGLARHRFNPEPKFIPLPASWLRAGRWKDEPAPAPSQSARVAPPPYRENPGDRRRRALGLPSILDFDAERFGDEASTPSTRIGHDRHH